MAVDFRSIFVEKPNLVYKFLRLSPQQDLWIRQLADDLQLHGVIVSVAAAGNQIKL